MIKLDPWAKKEDVEILMEDRCTKDEAIRHLNKGTLVIPADEWDAYLEEYDDQFEDVEEYHKEWSLKNVKAGNLADHSFVEHNGKEYVIEYVL